MVVTNLNTLAFLLDDLDAAFLILLGDRLLWLSRKDLEFCTSQCHNKRFRLKTN